MRVHSSRFLVDPGMRIQLTVLGRGWDIPGYGYVNFSSSRIILIDGMDEGEYEEGWIFSRRALEQLIEERRNDL